MLEGGGGVRSPRFWPRPYCSPSSPIFGPTYNSPLQIFRPCNMPVSNWSISLNCHYFYLYYRSKWFTTENQGCLTEYAQQSGNVTSNHGSTRGSPASSYWTFATCPTATTCSASTPCSSSTRSSWTRGKRTPRGPNAPTSSPTTSATRTSKTSNGKCSTTYDARGSPGSHVSTTTTAPTPSRSTRSAWPTPVHAATPSRHARSSWGS